MKKAIIIAVLLCISLVSFSQAKPDTTKSDTLLTINKELALKLYTVIQIAEKALPPSLEIRSGDTNFAMPVLQQLSDLIVSKYADKPKKRPIPPTLKKQ